MKYFITDGNFNWADEISLDGFDIWTEDELNEARKDFDKGGTFYGKSVNVYVGSNEDQDIEAADVLGELRHPREITKEEYDVLKKLFGSSYGKTYFNEFTNYFCDEDVDVEDED